MKKVSLLVVLSFLTFLTSCEKEQSQEIKTNEQVSIEPTRVVFANWDEFENTVKELEASNSDDFIMNWIFEKGHSALYIQDFDDNDIDFAEAEKMTTSLLAIFNKNFQFEIGNEIISYEDGLLYSSSKTYLNNSKSIVKSEIGKIETSLTPIKLSENSKFDTESKVSINSNSGVAAYQEKSFTKYSYYDCVKRSSGKSTAKWKYVQYLKSVKILTNYYQSTTVYLNCRLYLNTGSGYRRSHSRRNYKYNFSGEISWPGSVKTTFNFNDYDRKCTSSKFNSLSLGSQPLWLTAILEITGTGTVTHELNGNSASQKWTNQINW